MFPKAQYSAPRHMPSARGRVWNKLDSGTLTKVLPPNTHRLFVNHKASAAARGDSTASSQHPAPPQSPRTLQLSSLEPG